MGRRRGRPPACGEAVAYLTGANRTKEGPKIQSELDEGGDGEPCQPARQISRRVRRHTGTSIKKSECAEEDSDREHCPNDQAGRKPLTQARRNVASEWKSPPRADQPLPADSTSLSVIGRWV